MQFGGRAAVLQSPTKDRDAVRAAVARLTPRGGTAMGDAIVTALRALKQPAGINGKRPPAATAADQRRRLHARGRAGRRRPAGPPPEDPRLHRRPGHRRRHDHGQAQGRLDRDPPRAARPQHPAPGRPRVGRAVLHRGRRQGPGRDLQEARLPARAQAAEARDQARRSRAARCCCCSWAPEPPCASSAASSDVTRRPTDPCPT